MPRKTAEERIQEYEQRKLAHPYIYVRRSRVEQAKLDERRRIIAKGALETRLKNMREVSKSFACVYGLVRGRELFYVGSTKNLTKRIINHRHKRGINLSYVVLEKTKDSQREKMWIEFFEQELHVPLINITYSTCNLPK
jgi:hypothetical protein